MTWTMPWPASPIGRSRTPNSAQFLRSVSTCSRETGSAMGRSTSVVGTLWSSVARVSSGRRTGRPGLARPTAPRLAVALDHHGLVARDTQGRFVLGPRLPELAAAAGDDRLLAVAGPVLARLRDQTGESAQLYRRRGDLRVCVAA